MELKIGKRYQVREPKFAKQYGVKSNVLIVRKAEFSDSVFVGDDNCYYWKNGFSHSDNPMFDLVTPLNEE